LLSKKTGSNKRATVVKENANNSLFAPEHTNKRIVLSLLIWVPALVILAMVGYLATFIQIYGVGFLLTAITGVFVLFLSIFPTFQRFAKQFAGKLVGFLAMCIGLTVLLILLFSFVNITYKVASENNWAYAQTIVAVLIVVAAIFALQKQLFGYKIYSEKKQQIQQAWRQKVDAIKFRDAQRQYAHVEPFYTGDNVHSRSRSGQRGTTDARAREQMEKTMERQSNKPTLRRNKPIDSDGNVIEDAPKQNVMPFRKRQEKERKNNLSSENGVIPNPHKKDQASNHKQTVSNQIDRQQKNQEHAPLKAQPKGPQQEGVKENAPTSGKQNEQVMKKIKQQEKQEQAPLKAQPQQTPSSSQSSKVVEQMRRQEARSGNQQASIQPSRRLVPASGDVSTKQFNQENAPLKAQPKPPQTDKTNQKFHKQMRQQQAQQEIQQGKEEASVGNESNGSHIDRSKEIEQMRRQSQQD